MVVFELYSITRVQHVLYGRQLVKTKKLMYVWHYLESRVTSLSKTWTTLIENIEVFQNDALTHCYVQSRTKCFIQVCLYIHINSSKMMIMQLHSKSCVYQFYCFPYLFICG